MQFGRVAMFAAFLLSLSACGDGSAPSRYELGVLVGPNSAQATSVFSDLCDANCDGEIDPVMGGSVRGMEVSGVDNDFYALVTGTIGVTIFQDITEHFHDAAETRLKTQYPTGSGEPVDYGEWWGVYFMPACLSGSGTMTYVERGVAEVTSEQDIEYEEYIRSYDIIFSDCRMLGDFLGDSGIESLTLDGSVHFENQFEAGVVHERGLDFYGALVINPDETLPNATPVWGSNIPVNFAVFNVTGPSDSNAGNKICYGFITGSEMECTNEGGVYYEGASVAPMLWHWFE
ncbi:MAG: hypothetical protein KDH09_14145 [Chrysiogenetes bacterium]|nr:hypothetical protein [Chrysiogenetes bacterium]